SGISVKGHAPHVDTRTDPSKSRVTLTASIPSLKKAFTVERRVTSPNDPVITPAEPDILAVVREVQRLPEFALSRREIIKYVIPTPGDRSDEVQALLRLEKIGQLRQAIQKVANSLERE